MYHFYHSLFTVARGEIDTPTEAPGSVGIGAAALIVLLAEMLSFLILDAPTVVQQLRLLVINLRDVLRGKPVIQPADIEPKIVDSELMEEDVCEDLEMNLPQDTDMTIDE